MEYGRIRSIAEDNLRSKYIKKLENYFKIIEKILKSDLLNESKVFAILNVIQKVKKII